MENEPLRDKRGNLIGNRASGLSGTGPYVKRLMPINFKKVFSNPYENMAAAYAREAGWEATKRGWPDLILYREKGGTLEVMFVEVKASKEHRFSSPQERLFGILKSFGIDVKRWSPDEMMDFS